MVYLVAKERRGLYYYLWNTSNQGKWILHYTKMIEGPVVPPPVNCDHNMDGNANQPDQDKDNNAPAGPPNAPPNQPPNQLPNQPAPQQPPPQQPVPNWLQPVVCQPAPQIIHQQMVNWSHFKSEFTGKPEEDAEAHLLCTNDWMWTHNFEENVKVNRFCLTLLGEVRIWYKTLNPDAFDWPALQNAFRQQYSKLGNTPEQYFQWRSFYFDENADNIDSYVTRVSQCAVMLNYGEPQILEVMNTLPSRLYLILFPIDNLRDAITTAKQVMIKEKIDRPITCHSIYESE